MILYRRTWALRRTRVRKEKGTVTFSRVTFSRAQSWTVRLKLLKIGAQVRVATRKVWLSFSESYPYATLLGTILARVQAHPLRC